MTDIKYEAIIFDLDGTLINSVNDLGNAVNRALEFFNFPPHPLEDYNSFIGDGAEMMVKRALPEDRRDDVTVRKCLDLFLEDYFDNYCVYTKPYSGIPQLLDALDRKKVKTAVLTNKPYEVSEKIIAELFPNWHFEMIIGQMEGIPRKPDPTGALIISRKIEIDPGKIVYLGDSGVDMDTAKSAGMLPVGVLWGFRDFEELKEHGAHILINSPEEILEHVQFAEQ